MELFTSYQRGDQESQLYSFADDRPSFDSWLEFADDSGDCFSYRYSPVVVRSVTFHKVVYVPEVREVTTAGRTCPCSSSPRFAQDNLPR